MLVSVIPYTSEPSKTSTGNQDIFWHFPNCSTYLQITLVCPKSIHVKKQRKTSNNLVNLNARGKLLRQAFLFVYA